VACGLGEDVNWNEPQLILVYIDGAAFIGPGTDTTFNERAAMAGLELGEIGEYRWDPVFCGLAFDIPSRSWTIKESFHGKVVHDPEVLSVRAVLGVIGRVFAALRYLALPLAVMPSGYRFGADTLGSVHHEEGLEQVVAWPAALVDELTHARALVGVRRVWRPLPERRLFVCADATLVGWAVDAFVMGRRLCMPPGGHLFKHLCQCVR